MKIMDRIKFTLLKKKKKSNVGVELEIELEREKGEEKRWREFNQ